MCCEFEMFRYIVSLTLLVLVTNVGAGLKFNYFRTRSANDPDIEYCLEDIDCNTAVLCRCAVMNVGPKQCVCNSAMSYADLSRKKKEGISNNENSKRRRS